jgi:hypothetical protein
MRVSVASGAGGALINLEEPSARSHGHFVNCDDAESVEEAQSARVPWQTTQEALDERRGDESIVRVKVEG